MSATYSPVIFDPTKFGSCHILCDLTLNYSTGFPIAHFSKQPHDKHYLKFLYKRNKNSAIHDIIFRNKKYILKEFTIHDRLHQTYPVLNKYPTVGELVLLHQNIEDSSDFLVLSVFIYITSNNDVNMSQNFFSQISDNSAFKSFVDNSNRTNLSFDINVKPNWSPRFVMPGSNSFLLYKGCLPYISAQKQDVTYIVFTEPIRIRFNDFKSFTKFQFPPYPENKASLKIYYNSGIKKCAIKYQNTPKNVANPGSCDDEELDSDLHKDNYKSLYNESQGRFAVFFYSLIGLFLVLFFFKYSEMTDSSQFLIKLTGLVVWSIVHFTYIWYARFWTIFLFGLIWITLYFTSIISSKISSIIHRFKKNKTKDTPEISEPIDITDNPNTFHCKNKKSRHQKIWCQMMTSMYHPENTEFIIIAKIIALFYLIRFFINYFGALRTNTQYSFNGTLCRNKLKILGNSFSLDKCYKPVKLNSVIESGKSRKEFDSNYNKFRKNNLNAIQSVKLSLKKIDQRINFDHNYKTTLENGNMSRVQACKLYNKMFANTFPKKCEEIELDKIDIQS